MRDPQSQSIRILVADDDELVREFCVRTLLCFGYHVETAQDGDAAWTALETKHYDLVITDHSMPKVTGIELAQKLWSAQMAVPVILISGVLPLEELGRHPWLKFVAIVSKPYSSEKLLSVVKEALLVRETTAVPNGVLFSGMAAAENQNEFTD
jgi:DNA-binding NtrC family response regulator